MPVDHNLDFTDDHTMINSVFAKRHPFVQIQIKLLNDFNLQIPNYQSQNRLTDEVMSENLLSAMTNKLLTYQRYLPKPLNVQWVNHVLNDLAPDQLEGVCLFLIRNRGVLLHALYVLNIDNLSTELENNVFKHQTNIHQFFDYGFILEQEFLKMFNQTSTEVK